jgi:azurin
MHFVRVALGLVALVSALTGCGPAEREPAPGGSASISPAPAVAAGTPEAPREVKVEVGDAMKFSLTRIEAEAGETVRLLLVNTGSAPKEAMGHNWVLLKMGADPVAYANDALKARATDYIPPGRADEVVAHTRLIGGRARDAVVFTVPAQPGDYVFICTFPAHLQLGMKGVLAVK